MSVGITLSDEVRASLAVAAVHASPVTVGDASASLLDEADRLSAACAEAWGGRRPAEIEALAPARALYRAFGIDPTRTRPSSEALLRRVLKGRPLPRISSAVDLCNLLALRLMLPLGLYDVARITGPIVIRRGRDGESYEGIRKGRVNLGGRPVVADSSGAFGNPTSDSLRTAVGPETTSLLLVVFAPGDTTPETMAAHAEASRAAMHRHLGDRVIATTLQVL